MKKIIIHSVVLLSLIFASCTADKEIPVSQVPAPAVSAFNARYPTASDVKWVTENKDSKKIYAAHFKLENQNFEAEFDAEGRLILEH